MTHPAIRLYEPPSEKADDADEFYVKLTFIESDMIGTIRRLGLEEAASRLHRVGKYAARSRRSAQA